MGTDRCCNSTLLPVTPLEPCVIGFVEFGNVKSETMNCTAPRITATASPWQVWRGSWRTSAANPPVEVTARPATGHSHEAISSAWHWGVPPLRPPPLHFPKKRTQRTCFFSSWFCRGTGCFISVGPVSMRKSARSCRYMYCERSRKVIPISHFFLITISRYCMYRVGALTLSQTNCWTNLQAKSNCAVYKGSAPAFVATPMEFWYRVIGGEYPGYSRYCLMPPFSVSERVRWNL